MTPASDIRHSRADVLGGLWVLVWILGGVAMVGHIVLLAVGAVTTTGWSWWVALAILLLGNVLTLAIRVVE